MRNVTDACRVCKHKESTLAECMQKCNVLFLTVKNIEKDRNRKVMEGKR